MRSCQICVQITADICVVDWWKGLGSVLTIDTREVFVDGVSIVAKVGGPSSPAQKLNFNSEIRCSGCGEVVRRGELKPKMGLFINLLGQ